MTLATRNDRGLLSPFDGNDLDAFVQRVFGREGMPVPYGVDIYENADSIHFDVELPGFTKGEVDVTIDNNVLTITAQRQPKDVEGEKAGWLLKERRYARFQRSFSLPNTVDGTTVDAKLADGILHLTLNKRQEAKPRKISIG